MFWDLGCLKKKTWIQLYPQWRRSRIHILIFPFSFSVFFVQLFDAINLVCLPTDKSLYQPLFQKGKQNKLINMSNCIWCLALGVSNQIRILAVRLPGTWFAVSTAFAEPAFCLCLCCVPDPFQLCGLHFYFAAWLLFSISIFYTPLYFWHLFSQQSVFYIFASWHLS